MMSIVFMHRVDPYFPSVPMGNRTRGNKTNSIGKEREQRTIYIENNCLRGIDSDESPT